MEQLITRVEGTAKKLGIVPGDILMSINREPIYDIIDYQALTAASTLRLAIKRGEKLITLTALKHPDSPLGLTFESDLLTPTRLCKNHCVFCFVDQLPPGCRPTMRVKDDDWRLSLIMGNYVTLTNVTSAELERIGKRKVSPLYVSVHAVQPKLRAYMLGNPAAASILDQIDTLINLNPDIRIYAQAVLCPGINDAAPLDETVFELERRFPNVDSLSIVPIGITGFRQGLTQIPPYTPKTAADILRRTANWQHEHIRKNGSVFVYAADEFFAMADTPPPDTEHYGAFSHIENGVGMLSIFEEEFREANQNDVNYENFEQEASNERQIHIAVVTGISAAPYLSRWIAEYQKPDQKITVYPVENNFFGGHVTVAGLLTGIDILTQLKKENIDKKADIVLVPASALRDTGESPVFLDDMSLSELSFMLGTPVVAVKPDGYSLYRALHGDKNI